jgi:hypothetical protein
VGKVGDFSQLPEEDTPPRQLPRYITSSSSHQIDIHISSSLRFSKYCNSFESYSTAFFFPWNTTGWIKRLGIVINFFGQQRGA